MLCLRYSEKPCKHYLNGLSTILPPPHTLPLAGQMVYEAGQFLLDFSLISYTSAVIILLIHLETVNLEYYCQNTYKFGGSIKIL